MSQDKPDFVVHYAAWTVVDLAEAPSLRAKMRATNVDGTQNIADICKTLDCKLVYLSTNYEFDGFGKAFWPPDFNTLNVYGQSKLDWEQSVAKTLDKHFIVRIAWNAPHLGIVWPEVTGQYCGNARPEGYSMADGIPLTLSEKDQKQSSFTSCYTYFDDRHDVII